MDKHPGPALHLALLLALVGPTFTMAVLPPALPLMAGALGQGEHGAILAQLAQSLPFLGLAVGGLFVGGVLGRWGLKPSLVGAAVVYGAVGALAGAAQGPGVLLAGCLVLGLAAAVLSAGLTTATGAAFSGAARGRALGFQTAFSDASAIGGGLAAAFLAQAYGWRAPFAIYAAFGALIVALVLPSKLPAIEAAPASRAVLTEVVRSAGSTYVAALLLFIVMGTQATLLPFHLAAHGLSTPGERALVLSAGPATAIVASVLYGVFAGRISERATVLIATLVSVAGYGGLGLWRGGLILAAPASMAVGCGMGLAFPMVIRTVFRRTEPAMHGHAIGLLNTCVFLGAFLSPLLLGPLMRAGGGKALFLTCAAAWLAGGAATVGRLRASAAAASTTGATRGLAGAQQRSLFHPPAENGAKA